MQTPQLNQCAFIHLEQRDELEVLAIEHPLFSAAIALQGAQLLSFQPKGQPSKGQAPWIWLSPDSEYKAGQSLRGGIPICWPWFGAANKNPNAVQQQITHIDNAPAHGFARSINWQIDSVHESCHEIRVVLSLSHNAESLSIWPFEFRVKAEFTLGRTLQVALTTTNLSQRNMALTQALHTYYPSNDIGNVSIAGTANQTYTDALDRWQAFTQANTQVFNQEVDRIFHTGGPFGFSVGDQNGTQRLTLTAENSASTIIWNPWIEKAKRLSQFADNAYQTMFCVETANALDDAQTLAPNATHRLSLMLARG